MRKAILAAAVLLLCAAFAACSTLNTVGALLGDSVRFTAPQLQAYLDREYPRDYDQLGGLVTLSLLNPRLSIRDDSNRLQLEFDVGFGALGRDSRDPAGHFAVASGLRWDPRTRGLHLDAPTLESVDIPQLGGAMNATGRGLINRWLADYARDEPVYEFEPGLWQRIASRRIDSTTIEDGQVVVHLGQ